MKGLHPPRIHRIHSRRVYGPCDESWDGLHPPKIHRFHSRPVYNPCDKFLKGLHLPRIGRIHPIQVYSPCDSLDRPRIHRMHSRLVYRPCDESSKGLHPPKIRRIHSRPVYSPCEESLEGLHPSRMYCMPSTSMLRCREGHHVGTGAPICPAHRPAAGASSPSTEFELLVGELCAICKSVHFKDSSHPPYIGVKPRR